MAEPRTVGVRFSCQGCGLKDVLVKVPAREDPDAEPIKEWIDKLGYWMSKAHRRLSKNCTSLVMSNVVIPTGSKDDEHGWAGKYTEITPPRNLAETIKETEDDQASDQQ